MQAGFLNLKSFQREHVCRIAFTLLSGNRAATICNTCGGKSLITHRLSRARFIVRVRVHMCIA